MFFVIQTIETTDNVLGIIPKTVLSLSSFSRTFDTLMITKVGGEIEAESFGFFAIENKNQKLKVE